jgi:acyl transferase domain-containing protein
MELPVMQDSESPPDEGNLDVAIIGIAGRFPGAATAEEFFQRLCAGYDAATDFTTEELRAAGVSDFVITNPRHVKSGVMLEDADCFDSDFFGYTPREARFMDPQHRLFLESTWAALEDAGYVDESTAGRIGIFASAGASTYFLENLRHLIPDSHSPDAYEISLGNDKDFLATRTAHRLNLTGPALSVQTACSSSLVAVHLACQALLTGQCELALAGGSKVLANPKDGYVYQSGAILSPDGRCRPFDAQAAGTINGSGVGVVVLKPLDRALADRDHVYAVIKSTAVNNDGARKIGYTAPSVEGQRDVILSAHALAGIDADTLSYVEAHGTGTALGDPIEVAALTQAFRATTQQRGYCALGSVKSNVGHLDTAAGVTGLIKTALALHHRELPPTAHYARPNPTLELAESPFFVSGTRRAWPVGNAKRRAGVSSFGIGGTNAHAVLEEAPAASAAAALPGSSEGAPELIQLSARTESQLDRAEAELAAHLRKHREISLADCAHTLREGRKGFACRTAVVAATVEDLCSALETRAVIRGRAPEKAAPVVFLFPGQGSQYPGMGRGLYERFAVYRKHLDACASALSAHAGFDVRALILTGPPETAEQDLASTARTQPAVFAVEYALAMTWRDWGITPSALLGHSLGEYVAAVIAGVLSLPDAARIVALRGQLVDRLPGGAMLSVNLSERDVAARLGDELDLAAVNAPESCVVAGPESAVERLRRELADAGITCQRLRVSHAFHSRAMRPVAEELKELLAGASLKALQIPLLSNLSGRFMEPAEVTRAEYWARQLISPVRCAEAYRTLGERFPEATLLEVGPGVVMSTLARHCAGTSKWTTIPSLRHPADATPDDRILLGALGRLWTRGVTAKPTRRAARRVPLPTYPFERRRLWIDRPSLVAREALAELTQDDRASLREAAAIASARDADRLDSAPAGRPSLSTPWVKPSNELEEALLALWEEQFGLEGLGTQDSFFELGGHSLLAAQIVNRLRDRLDIEVSVGTFLQFPTVAGVSNQILEELSQSLDGAQLSADDAHAGASS